MRASCDCGSQVRLGATVVCPHRRSRPGYLASAGLLLPAASHPYLGRSTLDCWHVFTLPELDRDWRAWDWFRTRRRRYGRLTVLTAMTPPIRISALRPNSSQREDR